MAIEPKSLVADQPLEVGDSVGDYVVEGLLGKGTFGAVYRGIQPDIGKRVAIKVLALRFSTDPTVLSRFVLEARAVNQIGHQNIIDIFTFGQLVDGRHYHVMELLEGLPLDEHLRNRGGRLPTDEALEILRGVARALDAAHAKNIVHRDLKPANVFLARDAEGRPFPKLLDFGIAKLLSDDLPKTHETATGAAVGTPDFMSPEQCRGPEVDHRSDIYALGVLAYVLLSGRRPFRGSSVVEVMMGHLSTPAPPFSSVAPELGMSFDAVFSSLLAKVPEHRPSSAREAVAALEAGAKRGGHSVPVGHITMDPESSSGGTGPGTAVVDRPWVTADALAAAVPRRLGVGRWAVLGAFAGIVSLGLTLSLWSKAPSLTPIPVEKVSTSLSEGAREQRDRGQDGESSEGRTSASTAFEHPNPSEPATRDAPRPGPVEPSDSPVRAGDPGTTKRSIRLRIAGSPKGATVRLGRRRILGRLPLDVSLRRREEPIVLVVRARGFRAQRLVVTPKDDQDLQVDLQKKGPQRPNRNALEEPRW